MKPFTLSLALACSLFTSIPAVAQEAPKNDPLLKSQQAFANLAPEKREEFMKGFAKAQQLTKQKRYIDALEKTFEIDKIFPDHPATLALRASSHIQLRSFKKAEAIYKQMLDLNPDSLEARFNKAEIQFVTHNWQAAHDGFEKIVDLKNENSNQFGEIAVFKLFVCKVKIGDMNGAEELASKFTKWDETPMYYYAKAVLEHAADDKKASQKTLQNCYFVWGNAPIIAIFQDTMIEAGYLNSHLHAPEKGKPFEPLQ